MRLTLPVIASLVLACGASRPTQLSISGLLDLPPLTENDAVDGAPASSEPRAAVSAAPVSPATSSPTATPDPGSMPSAPFPPEPPHMSAFGAMSRGESEVWIKDQEVSQPARDLFATWTKAWSSSGYKLVSELHGDRFQTAALRHTSGAVVALLVKATETTRKATFWVTPRPASPARVIGPCRQPETLTLTVGITSMGIDDGGEPFGGHVQRQESEWLFDLDGDGVLDVVSPMRTAGQDCPEDVMYRAQLTRGSCVHQAGVVGPGNVSFDRRTPNGSGALVAQMRRSKHGKDVIPIREEATRLFELRDGRYVKVSEQRHEGECHHCSTYSCQSKP